MAPMIQQELATCGFSMPLQSSMPCATRNPNGLVPPPLPPGSPPVSGIRYRAVIGIPWTPDEFIDQALSVGHS